MFSDRILKCLKPPGEDDDRNLEVVDDGLRCTDTGQTFPYIDGVPSLYARPTGVAEGVTSQVRSFYEENPFPSYEGLEEFGELVSKGNSSGFAKSLLSSIGYNKLILECGCGTGQLSHYLQLNHNHVLGIDMYIGSLKLVVEHRQRNQLERSGFAQMNIFDLGIKDEAFDVVISNGVLHHTYDARGRSVRLSGS